jgi:hypothetical protein
MNTSILCEEAEDGAGTEDGAAHRTARTYCTPARLHAFALERGENHGALSSKST